jgi:hypothetical protein
MNEEEKGREKKEERKRMGCYIQREPNLAGSRAKFG